MSEGGGANDNHYVRKPKINYTIKFVTRNIHT
jgi:hypothetical protein